MMCYPHPPALPVNRPAASQRLKPGMGKAESISSAFTVQSSLSLFFSLFNFITSERLARERAPFLYVYKATVGRTSQSRP